MTTFKQAFIRMPIVDGPRSGDVITVRRPEAMVVETVEPIGETHLRQEQYLVRKLVITMPGRTDLQRCKVLTLWSEPTLETAWRGIVKAWASGWTPDIQYPLLDARWPWTLDSQYPL